MLTKVYSFHLFNQSNIVNSSSPQNDLYALLYIALNEANSYSYYVSSLSFIFFFLLAAVYGKSPFRKDRSSELFHPYKTVTILHFCKHTNYELKGYYEKFQLLLNWPTSLFAIVDNFVWQAGSRRTNESGWCWWVAHVHPYFASTYIVPPTTQLFLFHHLQSVDVSSKR